MIEQPKNDWEREWEESAFNRDLTLKEKIVLGTLLVLINAYFITSLIIGCGLESKIRTIYTDTIVWINDIKK